MADPRYEAAQLLYIDDYRQRNGFGPSWLDSFATLSGEDQAVWLRRASIARTGAA